MKALVTGGAGFIGSHLCDKLIERGDYVICVDNLLTSTGKNIEHLQNNPNFRFIKQDVSLELPVDVEAEAVFHFASPASPHPSNLLSYMKLPFETMKANSFGTWMLCEWANKKKAKFLFASTSEAYGDPLIHPQTEDYRGNVSTVGPRSVYDEAKRFGETITQAFVREKGLDGRVIRIFNTYGPRMNDDGRVVTEFLESALTGSPIPVFGDGNQTRSFCYISDLVEGITLAMDKDRTRGEVFNLGNQNEFTINDLANKVKAVANSNSQISYARSLPEDDPAKRCPDITKARTVLGWEPKVNLEDGLRMYADYLKNR